MIGRLDGSTSMIPSQVFATLPQQLRMDLLDAFERIVRNFAEGRWEPAELNGGKLCEASYSVCRGIIESSLPARASKPSNLVAACQALERQGHAPRSVRVQIPRMILALYEIRNNRNVGHVGGDVDPNHMDAVCVLQMSKWIMAELVRVLHELPVDEASQLVDGLVDREVPLVWKVGNKRRVLDPKMSMPDKTLLLLHGSARPLAEAELFSWVEHSRAAIYRRDVLKRLHKARMLEYDPERESVTISPLGIEHVEQNLIKRT